MRDSRQPLSRATSQLSDQTKRFRQATRTGLPADVTTKLVEFVLLSGDVILKIEEELRQIQQAHTDVAKKHDASRTAFAKRVQELSGLLQRFLGDVQKDLR